MRIESNRRAKASPSRTQIEILGYLRCLSGLSEACRIGSFFKSGGVFYALVAKRAAAGGGQANRASRYPRNDYVRSWIAAALILGPRHATRTVGLPGCRSRMLLDRAVDPGRSQPTTSPKRTKPLASQPHVRPAAFVADCCSAAGTYQRLAGPCCGRHAAAGPLPAALFGVPGISRALNGGGTAGGARTLPDLRNHASAHDPHGDDRLRPRPAGCRLSGAPLPSPSVANCQRSTDAPN